LGPFSRETEDNAYTKFWLRNKEHYGMLQYFLDWSIPTPSQITLTSTPPNIYLIISLSQITRYQSLPGQATSYMVGKLGIVQARDYATSALGKNFSLKDFHYQVLKWLI